MVTPFEVSNVFFCLIFTIEVEAWSIFGSKAFVADKHSTCTEDQSKSGMVSLPFNPLTHTTILVLSTCYNPTQCFSGHLRVSTVSWMGMNPTGRVSLMSINFMSTRTLPRWLWRSRSRRESKFEKSNPTEWNSVWNWVKALVFLAVWANLRFLWRRPSWSTGSGSPWIWKVRLSTNQHPDRR